MLQIHKACIIFQKLICIFAVLLAQVVKLVDTLSSGGSSARCAGSSPVLGTSKDDCLNRLFYGIDSISFLAALNGSNPPLTAVSISIIPFLYLSSDSSLAFQIC